MEGMQSFLMRGEKAGTIAASQDQTLVTKYAFDVRNSNISDTNGSIQSSAKHNVQSNNVVWDVEGD